MSRYKEEILEAIKNNNLSKVKAVLNNAVLWDCSDVEQIKELAQIADKAGVFEPLDEPIDKISKVEWNEDYQDSVQTDLIMNYSRERFEYFFEVAYYNHVQANKKATTNIEVRGSDTPKQRVGTTSKSSVKKKKNNNLPLIIGIIVILIVVIMMVKII